MKKFQLEEFLSASEAVIKGKRDIAFLALCNFVSLGHTLIEDVPGVGKTTLVKFFAHTFGLNLSRIQFTNDLLPGDILGNHIYNKESQNFEFYPGPIFGELVLADELNRAPSKTQSALLQAMEEKRISLDSKNYDLPSPFVVFATQNPHGQFGTFELPESQLDRFSMKINIGYADELSTIELLKQGEDTYKTSGLIYSKEELLEMHKKSLETFISEEVYQYIYKVLNFTRLNHEVLPLSNRAGLDLVRVAKSFAYLKGRDFVTPEDVQEIFPYICGHRLLRGRHTSIKEERDLATRVLSQVKLR